MTPAEMGAIRALVARPRYVNCSGYEYDLRNAVEQLFVELNARDERIRVLEEGVRVHCAYLRELNLSVAGKQRWIARSALEEWERQHEEEVRTDG